MALHDFKFRKIIWTFTMLLLTACPLRAANTPIPTIAIVNTPNYSRTITPTLLPFTGKLAFVSCDTMDNCQIQVMKANGSEIKGITLPNLTEIGYLSWSPDGRFIAFQARKDGVKQIFTIKSNGADMVQLTSGEDDSFGNSWSPDGQHFIFNTMNDGLNQIYKIRADGSELAQLTHGKAGASPLWSPDGRDILFIYHNPAISDFTGVPGAPQIYIMNSDGTNIHHLAVKTKPDDTIMWGSYREDGLIAVVEPITRYAVTNYVVDSNGVIQEQFPEFSTELPITWSPDGKYVAYNRGYRVPGCFGIVVMKFDKSESKCLLDQKLDPPIVYFSEIFWSPDSKNIVFRSNLDGNWDIYVIKPDGSGLTRLTNTPETEYWVVWSETP